MPNLHHLDVSATTLSAFPRLLTRRKWGAGLSFDEPERVPETGVAATGMRDARSR